MGWRRGRAYSQDLRDRVLAAVDGGMAVSEAGRVFRVSVSYIYKALIRRRRTGETAARPSVGRPGTKLAAHEAALLARLRERPDATLAELRAWLTAERGVSVGIGTVWGTLDRLGWTLKKSRGGRRSRIVPTSPRPAPNGASASPT